MLQRSSTAFAGDGCAKCSAAGVLKLLLILVLYIMHVIAWRSNDRPNSLAVAIRALETQS